MAVITNTTIRIAEGTAPATPSTGNTVIYVKADGLVYSKDDGGVESALGLVVPVTHENGGLEADVSAYSGLVKITGGATSAVTAPSGTIVGTTDAQTLTEKTLTNSKMTTQTLSDGATVNWDCDDGDFATLTLGGNRTLAAPTNLNNGASYILVLKQDGTGSRTVTWNSVFKWPAGTAPTLSTGANAVDLLTFVSDGTNLYGSSQLDYS